MQGECRLFPRRRAPGTGNARRAGCGRGRFTGVRPTRRRSARCPATAGVRIRSRICSFWLPTSCRECPAARSHGAWMLGDCGGPGDPGRPSESTHDPGIDAHSVGGRGCGHMRVELGTQTDVELAGEGPARFHAVLFTPLEVCIDGPLELPPQVSGIGRLEGRDRVGSAIDDPAVEDFDGIIELYGRDIPLVLYHGSIPAALRNDAMSRTVARPTFGPGWGR